MTIWPWGRRRAILLVDFDNVGSERLSEAPEAWVKWLENGAGDGKAWRCKVVERLVYWNDQNPERARATRARFEHAGFVYASTRSIVPGKSVSDTVIAYDIGRLIAANPRYTDVFLFSADSDFLPLVKRVQSEGRRVSVFSRPDVVPAYATAADRAIDEDDVLAGGAVLGRQAAEERRSGGSDEASAELADLARALVTKMRTTGQTRLALADLRAFLQRQRGDFTDEGAPYLRWLGYGDHRTLMEALAAAHGELTLGPPQRGRYSLVLTD